MDKGHIIEDCQKEAFFGDPRLIAAVIPPTHHGDAPL
jgi:hypothetical protein